MLRVRVLGDLAFEVDGKRVDPPAGRRAREVAGWLAVHPGLHGRSELAARFWPDVLDSSARASLRTALHELRRSLGDEGARHLVATRDRVGLGADGEVSVDALEFRRLVEAGAPGDAIELARGEPLPGLDEDWVLAVRDDHRDRLTGAYEQLAAAAEQAGDTAAALRFTREQVKADPFSEEAHRALMRRLARAGDRPAALAAYGRLEDRLRRELRVPPSRATRDLAAELRDGDREARATPGPVPAGPAPLPRPLRRRERSGFVGRDAEVDRVARLVGAGSTLVLVAGEPGIGKTRLVAEVCRRAHADGALVLYGRCYEDQLAPYGPFAEALAGYLADPALARAAAGVSAPELARLVPSLAADLGTPSAPAATDPEGARWKLFDAVGRLLDHAAQRQPVLLAIDDLHWADAGALQLLAHLARGAGERSPALLATYRESELGRTHPLSGALADLRREHLVERVQLGGLPAPEVAHMVASWLGPGAPAELIAAVHTETGGNPFFVEELLRHLSESGAVRRDGAGWPTDLRVAGLGIPESVKEVVGRRAARLSGVCNHVLTAAAVIGRDFDLAVIERLPALQDEDCLAAIEEALVAQLVREEPDAAGRYGFVHPLIRETLYGELTLTRRVRLHAAVADALEQDDRSDLAEVALHRLQGATGGDVERAVETALAAARRAVTQTAYDEAAVICRRALEAVADEPGHRRCDVLLALGEALLRAGDPAAAREAFESAAADARELGYAARLAEAALGYSGLGVTLIAVDERAVALLEDARAGNVADEGVRARVLGRLAIETYYAADPAQRILLGDEAVAIARASGDQRALLDALGARHVALWSAAHLDDRLATAREMAGLAASAGDPERELQARNWLVLDHAEVGDIEAMRAEIERHERLAGDLRLPGYQWWGPAWRAALATLEGRFADARALSARSAEIGARAGDANAAVYDEIQAFVAMLTRERYDENAVDLAIIDRESGRPAEAAYRAGFAWLLAGRGQTAAARENVDWVVADGLARLRDDANLLASLAELTQACRLLDHAEPAPAIYERLLPYADRNIVNGRAGAGYGSASHHLAVLAVLMGDQADPEPHFRAALEANAALGAQPWLAHTRLRYGRWLSARGGAGDAERAAELLSAAGDAQRQTV